MCMECMWMIFRRNLFMEKVVKDQNGLHRELPPLEMLKEFTLLFLSLQNLSAVETISSIKACFLSLDTCLDIMLQVLSTALQFSRWISLPALHTLAPACCCLGRHPQPCLPWKVLNAPLRRAPTNLGSGKKAEDFRDAHYYSRLISQDSNSF